MNHRNKDYEEMELIYAGKMFMGSEKRNMSIS